jgi:hypothetical protein
MPTMRDPDIDMESQLAQCVVGGQLLDLAGEQEIDVYVMRTWDDARAVDANLIRDILRGRLASDPDPRGLRLRGARIVGRLDLENLSTAVALELHGCYLPEGLVARDASIPGLTVDDCLLEHSGEPPLAADRLRSAAGVSLVGTVILAGAPSGAVRFAAAHIGGQLNCSGATIRNSAGPALHADSMRVDQSVFLRHEFEAVGLGHNGAVHLSGARIGGQLDLSKATLRNATGPALDADRLHVDNGVYFRHGFEAVGAGAGGAIRLLGARIGVQLEFSDAKIRNESGPALAADRAQIDGSVFIRDGLEATGAGTDGAVRLPGVRVNGRLRLVAAGMTNISDPHARLLLDGLTYDGVPVGLSVDEWVALLRQDTPAYAAQPYQQLATAHRTAGNDREWRKILMAQRRHQIQAKALTGWSARIWAKLTGVTLGYGYQPWRALIGLLVVLAAAGSLCVAADKSLAHTRNSPTPGAGCTVVERMGVGIELGLPLIKTGARTQCDFATTTTGQALTVVGWGFQLLAWAFATLFIAGFTGAVRKT